MKSLLRSCLTALILFSAAFDAQAGRTSRSSAAFKTIVDDFTYKFKRLDAFNSGYYEIEETLGDFGDALTTQAIARPAALYTETLSQLAGISQSTLTEAEQITYWLLKTYLDNQLEGTRYPSRYMDVHLRGSRLNSFIDESSPNLSSFPFDTVAHYLKFVEKAQGLPAFVDRQILTLQDGIQKGYVQSCAVAHKVPDVLKVATEKVIDKNPFYRPTLQFPNSFTVEEKAQVRTAFAQMIEQIIIPSYLRFLDFYTNSYLPKCRSDYGYSTLPGGADWYRFTVRRQTDLAMDPAEIHQIGLNEVARIESQIDLIAKSMKFNGSTKDFLLWMVDNPQMKFKTGEDVRQAFENVRALINSKINSVFSLVPKSDYKIVSTENPHAVGASYMSPTESIPYGRFVFNGLNPAVTNLFDITTLSMHEAIPGHHFHLALQFENRKTLTEFQTRIFYSTAFTEGWALYAESLGDQMGTFTDPIQKFGNLNYELLRAVRLVVDTGIHFYKWDRARVIEYMTSHLAKNSAYIEGEADRYSVWPGQALAYKVGELKIRSLRTKAEQDLGAKFDIKKFHEVVLSSGSLSLPVLEQKVTKWIQSAK